MSYVLGIDLGTSSLKGLLMDQTGSVICEKNAKYSISIPNLGFSEQNPAHWINACEEILKAISNEVSDFNESLEGISFSGQMHTLVVLDSDNNPVYPAILWNDVRTTKQCEMIMKKMGDRLLEITKNIALEGFTLPKLLWLQENEPDIWKKVATIMLPKDYLSYWFTGNIYSEYSDAAGTLLLDIERREWSREIADNFDISLDLLPALLPSTAKAGIVKKALKERFNFSNDIQIFLGGADNACAALGAGLITEKEALISIGTSGVFSEYESSVKDFSGRLHFFNHVIPDAYYSMGVTLSAGNSLNWFKKNFGNELSFSDLLQEVSTVSPGSDGLLFTPYITGERTPYFDSKIRGSFIGIDTHHERAHFTRSVLEGITFSLKDSQIIIQEKKGIVFDRLISVGGGAKNSDWLQMQANIFNTEIICLDVEQGPATGACMIAAVGCEWYPDLMTAKEKFVNYHKKKYLPEVENVKRYECVYRIWKKIYNSTKDLCYETNQLYK